MSETRRPLEMFEGKGDTLHDALENAANQAIEKNIANDGKEYVIVSHTVTVSNPRISEHKVTLAAGEG
ncbi:MAG TPA: hypothetical protein VL264_11055 [Gaiella sp.]|nr:hypothetical protein [Gaiella sp.]